MKAKRLDEAIAEAKRFLARAEHLKTNGKQSLGYYEGTPDTSAVRRASLDLTRALAALRQDK